MNINFCTTIETRAIIDRYREVEACAEACRACRNYGRIWACPPFDFDPFDRIGHFGFATVFARKVILPDRLPLADLADHIRDIKHECERRLLELERLNSGYACILAGHCDKCDPLPCSRTEGRPCRHPDSARPSLEAFGFNLGKLIHDLFGLDFAWGTDGFAPPYIILVTALFHDSPQPVFPDND